MMFSAYNNTTARRFSTTLACVILLTMWTALASQTATGNSEPLISEETDFGLDIQMEKQAQLVAEALKLQGRRSLVFEGTAFSWDCSGTVLAASFNAGLDFRRQFALGDGNGVRRLYQIAVSQGALYDLPLPEIGDLIFWDNSYDYNNDGKWNDELTHVGLVVGIDSDGTITYLHHDYSRGIVTAVMNLWHAESSQLTLADGTVKTINSPLRMRSQRYINPNRWLSSHLFRGFARTALLQP